MTLGSKFRNQLITTYHKDAKLLNIFHGNNAEGFIQWINEPDTTNNNLLAFMACLKCVRYYTSSCFTHSHSFDSPYKADNITLIIQIKHWCLLKPNSLGNHTRLTLAVCLNDFVLLPCWNQLALKYSKPKHRLKNSALSTTTQLVLIGPSQNVLLKTTVTTSHGVQVLAEPTPKC